MFPNNQQVTEEIKMEIKILETNDNENMTIQNLWDVAKAVLFSFSFIFISWRLITLQYCSGFCHSLT